MFYYTEQHYTVARRYLSYVLLDTTALYSFNEKVDSSNAT